MTEYWIGQDGNVYVANADGTASNIGKPVTKLNGGIEAQLGSVQGKEISDPAPGGAASTNSASNRSSSYSAADTRQAAQDGKDQVERTKLKGDIKARGAGINSVYGDLFGSLDSLVRTRDAELGAQYGDQRTKAGTQYTDALPQIDQSYSAIGSYDSTQRGDSRGKAKTGFEDTLKTIGNNENADKTKLGQYANEQRAKFNADKASAERNLSRVDETTDIGALRGFRNDLESNLDTAGVTKASLGTNGAETVKGITGDNGRYEAAVNSLDSILKSSLGSDVKAAAVKAVTDSAGLSEADKKKVQATYGNVYSEQAAL